MNRASRPAAATPATPRTFRIGPWITVLALLVLGGVLMRRGYSYYKLDLSSRALHPEYRLLNPAGLLGHGYGIVGTALIATNLLYLVRRRFAKHFPSWAGSVQAWLNGHVLTGLLGSLLVVFHSAFQIRTPVAGVTSLSLGIVVVTGLVGLYLHLLLPRAGLKPFHARLEELAPLMPDLVRRVDEFVRSHPAKQLPADATFLRSMLTMPVWVWQARARRRGVRKAAQADKLLRVVARAEPRLAGDLVRELGDLAASEVDTHAGAAVMRSWRSLHRFLAILMLLSVSVHIAVAWYFGFRWVF